MSPTGHNITGLALACSLSAHYVVLGEYLEGALIAAGVMLGTRAPDWTEIAWWSNDKRYSLIPHRGPTHWPGWWMIGLFVSWWWVESIAKMPLVGFFCGALLHLVFDVMTPSGIPLKHPFARNKSFYIYQSRAFLPEMGLCVVSWLIAATVWVAVSV